MAEKDATDNGVSDQLDGSGDDQHTENETVFIGRDRETALEAMAEQFDKDRKGDLAYFDNDGNEVEPEPDAAASADGAEDGQDAGEAAAADAGDGEAGGEGEAAGQSDEDPEETIIVNGKEMKVKRSELLDAGRRTKQKMLAADEYLERASEALKRAEALEKKNPEARDAKAEPSDKDAHKDEKPDPELASANFRLDAARKAFAAATSDLDEDKIVRAQIDLEKAQRDVWRIETKPDHKPVDVDALARDVTDRVSKVTKVESLRQWAKLPADQGGVADMYADPTLWRMFDSEVRYLTASGKDGLDRATYAEAANNIRKLTGAGKNADEDKKSQAEIDKMESRVAAKKKLDNVRGVNARAPSTKDDDKPISRKQVIAEGIKDLQRGRIGALI